MLDQEAPAAFLSDQENPFAEALEEAAVTPEAIGFAPWNENETPFIAAFDGAATESETDRLVAEVYAELRDEGFDEAIAFLTEETEQVVVDRFTGETPANAAERERFADSYLAPVRFEAEQYIDSLEAGLTGSDLESFTEQQLDEVLDRFDPKSSDLTPAGEEFIGKLVKKAKNVVKSVVKTVGKVASAALGPILKKLRGLINPLLRRVLSFAIGRLPAPLQPAARKLAARFTSEAEAEEEFLDEAPASPANLTDVEALAESFDAALAEAFAPGMAEQEAEDFAFEDETVVEGRELEVLAEARGALIDRIRDASEDEDLSPAIEQFVPALLGALRLGINIIGRPKVVNFLAKYVAQLIGKWTGPELARPLSNAIVDTGLRLISLEAEAEAERTDEVAPAALASVIEDTVRQLAESEEYVFEDEDLTQLATAEAFSRAVGTNFPPRFVRPDVQQAPTLGGTFVSRRPRTLRPYRKYSRTPEVQVTPQMANSLPTFGGSTVGAAMRAAGTRLPMRARMHIYQAVPGTTVSRMVRTDRATAGAARNHISAANVHPLTPAAAGILLREPALGVQVPSAYGRSRNRIAAGQRLYILVPVDGVAAAAAPPPTAAGRAAAVRIAPSRAWTSVNLRRGRVTAGFYLSEAEAQQVAEAIRRGQGGPALLRALTQVYDEMDRLSRGGHTRIRREDEDREDREDREDSEDLAFRGGRRLAPALSVLLRKRLRGWVMPALATWVRNNAEAFARAAAHPEPGVTVRVLLTSVPGLSGMAAMHPGSGPGSIAQRGTPAVSITVTPGRRRK